MFKSFICLVWISLSLVASASEVEKLISEQKFQEALKLVQTELSKRKTQDPSYAELVLKETQLMIGLDSYETAVKMLRKRMTPASKELMVRTQLLLVYAHALRVYQQSYSWEINQRERVEGESELDLKKWTADQIYHEATRTLADLWAQREQLGTLQKDDIRNIVSPNNYPRGVRDTLRDSVTYLYTEYFTDSSGWTPKESNEVWGLDLKQLLNAGAVDLKNSAVHPLHKAASLLSDLAAWHKSKGRSEAALEARLQLIRVLQENFSDKTSREFLSQALKQEMDKNRNIAWVTMAFAQMAQSQMAAEAWDGRMKAMATAKECTTLHPTSLGAKRCRDIIKDIQHPEMSLSGMNVDAQGKRSFLVNYKNIKRLKFSSYAVDIETYLNGNKEYNVRPSGWQQAEKIFNTKPSKTWSVDVPATTDWRSHQYYVTPPAHKPGYYFVLAQDESTGLKSATQIFFSDLVLITHPHSQTSQMRVEVVNGSSGAAIPGVSVKMYRGDYRLGASVIETAITDKFGMVQFKPRDNQSQLYFVAKKGEQLVTSLNPTSFYAQGGKSPRISRTLTYLDRSIYRPGQKILWKTLAFQGDPNSAQYKLTPSIPITVSLHDANGQPVTEVTVKTNKYGSGHGSFTIPKSGKLLGQWSIHTTFGHTTTFLVEEYKRPTFEVTLEDAETPMRLNRPATIKARASYYFGAPVTQGRVKWSAERTPVLPWWCFWGRWSWGNTQSAQTVATGTTQLSKDGTLAINFTPKADERLASDDPDLRYNYTVKIDVTEAGGETRSIEGQYSVGFVTVMATLTPKDSFFIAGSVPEFTITRSDLSGAPEPGAGSWKLARLKGPSSTPSLAELGPPEELIEMTKIEFKTPDDLKLPRWTQGYDVKALLRRWKIDSMVAEGELKKGNATPVLPKLSAGAYRLSYQTRDSFGARASSEYDFLVVENGLKLPLPAFFAAQKDSVAVGEKIKLFVLSGYSQQRMVLEIFQKSQLQERRYPTSGSLIEIPVKESDRGGFSYQFYMVNDYQEITLQDNVSVPWSNKALSIAFSSFRDKMRPGNQESWRFQVLDENKKPLKAGLEVLAYMYDKSLDVFSPHTPPNPLSIYPGVSGSWSPQIELTVAPGVYVQSNYTGQSHEYTTPRADTMLFNPIYGIGGLGSRGSGGGGRRRGFTEGVAFKSMEAASDMAMAEAPMALAAPAGSAKKMSNLAEPERQAKPAAPAKGELRSEFSETGFWKPQLLADANGNFTLEFTAPDSVTAWNVWTHAISSDLRAGSLNKQSRTAKELMVRPSMPRFLREGDQVALKSVINNTGSTELSGELELSIQDPDTGKSLAREFAHEASKQKFKVKPNDSTTVTFKLKTPPRPGLVSFKVIARAGDLSDGELRPIPVLPGRMHLAQSKFVTLKDRDSKLLDISDFKTSDATRLNELLVVTLDAQLFYSTLSALPYLIDHPIKNTEQVLNSFISTGILTSVFDEFPNLKAMAREFSQKRKTRLEPWAQDDTNRKLALEESPWLQISKGTDMTDAVLVEVLNPAKARARRDSSLEWLEKTQLPHGGFPWFPGGEASPHMTLSVLYGFAKGVEFKVEVPKPMIAKGWKYLRNHYDKEIADVIKHKYCPEWLTFLNYILSSYPDLSWTAGVFEEEHRQQMLTISFAHWKNHSPYLKAFLALTLKRMGRAQDAKLVWDSVMDSSKTSAEEGTHWAAEDRSWLWYNDTIETHAMAIRTGSELGTSKVQLDGMVQWLFLNKKLNHWHSTRATAEVIYSLTHYLKKTKQLGVREKATLKFAGKTHEFDFDPARYSGKNNQVVLKEKEITSAALPAKVEKTTPGFLFASATWHYSTEALPKEPRGDFFQIERRYYKRSSSTGGAKLTLLKDGDPLSIGDEVEVQLSLTSRHEAEYVHLKDPRPAGFEPMDTVSRYKWDLGLGRYEEIRDSATNFFMQWLPKGQYTLKYQLRASHGGTFRSTPATIQPLYAPEFVGFSQGQIIHVD